MFGNKSNRPRDPKASTFTRSSFSARQQPDELEAVDAVLRALRELGEIFKCQGVPLRYYSRLACPHGFYKCVALHIIPTNGIHVTAVPPSGHKLGLVPVMWPDIRSSFRQLQRWRMHSWP